MKKIFVEYVQITVSIFFSLCCISFTFQKEIIDFNLIKSEASQFIERAKRNSIYNGKYNVYAIKFTSEAEGYCMTFGYISGPIDLPSLKNFKHYFYVDSELVVVQYPNFMKEKFTIINNSLLHLKNNSLITKKISPEPFLGANSAYLYCTVKGKTTKIFYDSDERVPSKKAIIKYKKSEGDLLQVDSASMKKMLNEEL